MTVDTAPGVAVAARWRLLSLGFAPPSEDTVDEVVALAESLLELDPWPEIEDVLSAACSIRAVELASEFHALFGGTVRVSPYEGSYELDPIRQGREMADVMAFYRAFGAEPSGPASERPDHVGCELEFLAFLELRLLAAVEAEEDAELLGAIRDSFLRDHAGRWLPTFFADVYETSDERGVYRALAALGARWVREELERRGVECAPLARRRQRLSVEGDSFACGGLSARSDGP